MSKELVNRLPGATKIYRLTQDHSVREAFFVFTLTRSLVFVIFILVGNLNLLPSGQSDFPTPDQQPVISLEKAPIAQKLRETMFRGDVTLYVHLGTHGYERHQFDVQKRESAFYAFFPVYPGVLWAVSKLTDDVTMGGAVVSNLCFFLAMVFLHKLTKLFGYTDQIADRTILYLGIFPLSYFYSIPMTESLFLLLTVISFYMAKRNQWVTAGAFGALASATRVTGVVLLPSLVILYWQRHRLDPRNASFYGLGLLVIPVGLLAYMFYSWSMTGNLWAFKDAQAGWSRQTGFFLTPLFNYVLNAAEVAVPWNFLSLNFAAAVLTFVCVYLLIRRREWSLAVYAFLTIVIPLSSNTLQSVGRYTIVIFPIYIALASIENSRRVDQVIRLIFTALLGLMTALFAAHFSIALA
jgi:hypothetical protein